MDTANTTLEIAHRIRDNEEQRNVYAFKAWIHYLLGDYEKAQEMFTQSKNIDKKIEKSIFSTWWEVYAEYLLRIGETVQARRITEERFKIVQKYSAKDYFMAFHRILGGIDTAEGQHTSAWQHCDEAIRLARTKSKREDLIFSLLARGRLAIQQDQALDAINDLNEALDYAVTSSYRIAEIDIRLALAWVHQITGNYSALQIEAERALAISRDVDYSPGFINAETMLKSIPKV